MPHDSATNCYCYPACRYRHVSAARNGQELDPATMAPLPPANTTHVAYSTFSAHWAAEMKLQEMGGKASLLRALRKSFGW